MSTPDINKLLRERPRSCKYGAPLGRINSCADEGTDFIEIGAAEVTGHGRYGGKAWAPDSMPAECVVLE